LPAVPASIAPIRYSGAARDEHQHADEDQQRRDQHDQLTRYWSCKSHAPPTAISIGR
jgi:hypothetical protein